MKYTVGGASVDPSHRSAAAVISPIIECSVALSAARSASKHKGKKASIAPVITASSGVVNMDTRVADGQYSQGPYCC